jgi:hypothetical protein
MKYLIYDKSADEFFFTKWFNFENFTKELIVIDVFTARRLIGVTKDHQPIWQGIEFDHL